MLGAKQFMLDAHFSKFTKDETQVEMDTDTSSSKSGSLSGFTVSLFFTKTN